MQYVYLDMNHWIALAQAESGRSPDGALAATLASARRLSAQEKISFPLSAAHFMELSKIGRSSRRHQLLDLFLELSRGWVVPARAHLLHPWIEYAVCRVLGLPTARPSRPRPTRGYFNTFPPGALKGIEATHPAAIGFAKAISDTPAGFASFLSFPDDAARRRVVERMTEKARMQCHNMASRRNSLRESSASERYRLYAATIFNDLQDEYARAILNVGLDSSELPDVSVDQALDFVRLVPVLHAELELAIVFERHWDRKFVPNDVYDLGGIIGAMTSCDALFSERQWEAMLSQTSLCSQLDVTVHSTIDDLGPLVNDAP